MVLETKSEKFGVRIEGISYSNFMRIKQEMVCMSIRNVLLINVSLLC